MSSYTPPTTSVMAFRPGEPGWGGEPSPFSSTPPAFDSMGSEGGMTRTLSSLGSDHEVKLWNNAQEQDDWERLANLYAIIMTIDRLENVYVKGGIEPAEYEAACKKLLAQCKTLARSLAQMVPDLDAFMTEYHMHCPGAKEVIKFGEPSTVRFGTGEEVEEDDSLASMQTATAALTVIEICMSGENDPSMMLACDMIKGYVDDVLKYLNKVNLPPDFNRDKLMGWVEHMNRMQAWEHLTANEARQLRADMESLKDRLTTALEDRRRNK